MSTKTLFLSSGHGGSDLGACANSLNERDWTAQFTDRVKYIIDNSFKCNNFKCIRVPNGPDAKSDVNGAVNFVNANYSPNEHTLAIDYHLNAATPTAKGWKIFCYYNDTQTRGIANTLATNLRCVYDHFGMPFRGIKDGSQFGFVGRTIPISFIFELAFLINPNEANVLKSHWESEKLVIAHAKALLDTLGVFYEIINPDINIMLNYL